MDNKNIDIYVQKKNYDAKSPLRDLRTFAVANNIPIISDEVVNFLKVLLTMKKPQTILELGTAIGYSSILFALNSSAEITTVELSDKMFEIAKKNTENFQLTNRINHVLADADEFLEQARLGQKLYDFIFIDAAKGQYLKYFKNAEKLVKVGGVIVCDNVLYKGLAAGARSVRRNRTIKTRMSEFVDYVNGNDDFQSSFISAGDGLIISVKIK